MSASRAGHEQLQWKMSGNNILPDPGNGGTIKVTADDAVCMLVSAGPETRRLQYHTGAESTPVGLPIGTIVTLQMKTDNGDITLELTADLDGTNTTVTFNTAGDWIMLRSDGTYWRLVANNGCTLS